jgi:Pin2-interacting protein X1
MGLAAPRKRLKIAHDPRNTAWTTSTTSIGHRLMTQQGWSAGQALGANTPTGTSSNSASGTSTPATSDEARLLASRVGVLFKDDTLGLGAKLASKDPAHARTGLDAFQGLLGRLNAKDEEDVKIVERKESERKLEGYARGKWGMVFVPGGVLVRGEEYGSKKEVKEKETGEERQEGEEGEEGADEVKRDEKRRRSEEKRKRKLLEEGSSAETGAVETANKTTDERAENERRKEERRKRKEEKRAQKSSKEASLESTPVPTSSTEHEPTVPAPRAEPPSTSKSSPDDAKPSSITKPTPPAPTSTRLSNTRGRQILRSRNIDAKRRAFADEKGLDGIFMRSSASASA